MTFTYQRMIFYVSGIVLLTLGIALTIQSNLGTGPFDALLVGLYRTFGLTIGSWEIVVGFLMILFNAVAVRRRPEYLALLTSFITGMCIDFWLFVLRDWIQPEAMVSIIICFGVGMVFAGLGIAINLQADFAPNPMDRSMLVVSHLTGLNIAVSRAIVSIVLVLLAFMFGGTIGVGTIIYALFSGAVIKFFIPYIAPLGKQQAEPQESISS